MSLPKNPRRDRARSGTRPSTSGATGIQVGHCVLERKLGKGGMGTVYLARHTTLNKRVAIKLLRGDLPSNANGVERFKREASSAGQLDHPNIVPVYDAGQEGKKYYIVMQYVLGESLAAKISREGVLRLGEALRIFRDVARGLQHAHGEGIIHRDVKPDNVLLGQDGSVKITDFGLARVIAGDPNLSITGETVLGSPSFMSPEQACGGEVDQRTDVYSLGATLYHMVTGKPPYDGDTTLGVVLKVVREPFTPPHRVNRRVPADLSKYICLLMHKDPAKRVPTVEKALALLDRYYPEGVDPEPVSRRGSRIAATSTALLGIGILTAGLLLHPWPAFLKRTEAQSVKDSTAAERVEPTKDEAWSKHESERLRDGERSTK